MFEKFVHNKLTHHKNARWIALSCYIVGILLAPIGYFIQEDWSIYVMLTTFIIWIPTIMWCAKRIEEGK